MTAKLVATVMVVLSGAGYLVYSSLDDVDYATDVHAVLAHPEKWEGKSLQVHGYAVPGTIKEEVVGQKLHRTFEIETCGKTIGVKHSGSKPDTFKEQAETVVRGKLVRENGILFVQAIEGDTGIIAKCPSKYDDGRSTPKCPAGI